MLDVIIGGVLRAIAAIVLKALFDVLFCEIGWMILKAITVGRYPPEKPYHHNVHFVAATGFIVPLVCVLLTIYWSTN